MVASTVLTHRRRRRIGLLVIVLGVLVGFTIGAWATNVNPAPE